MQIPGFPNSPCLSLELFNSDLSRTAAVGPESAASCGLLLRGRTLGQRTGHERYGDRKLRPVQGSNITVPNGSSISYT